MHSYFRLLTLSQKKTNCYFITHYIWKISPHYLVKIAQILLLFHFFTCIKYQFAIRMSCGTAASCCDMGRISAQHGGWYSWSVAKKTGSMYPCRRWSLWTCAVTLLAWHSICHTSQPVLFRATNANPQPAFLTAIKPSVRWKICAFYKVVRWHFSGVVVRGNSLFSSEIMHIR